MQVNVPPQLKRLALAFTVFILLFLIMRHLLVPKTFGQYGFYRGASLDEISNLPVKFAGQKACLDCHGDIGDLMGQDVHSDISCETCHGMGAQHVVNGDTTFLEMSVSRESCGICHGKNAARKKEAVFQVNLQEHNTGRKCIDCHNPHQPWNMKK
jgi:hypothetical protein